MTYYKKKYNLNKKKYQNSISYADENISLPVYPKLSFNDVDKICLEIKKFFKR